MHTTTEGDSTPHQRVQRRVIGGITLYPQQIAKLDRIAQAEGISRSAAIRLLIDRHA